MLPETLRALRKRRGLSQAELADQIGVKRNVLGMWEIGRNGPPTKYLLSLAEALGCTVDDLLNDQEEETTMCTKSRQKRERPSVTLTTRIDIPVADQINAICEETGQALSIVMEKLLLYALDHVRLVKVVRKDMQFDEPQTDPDEEVDLVDPDD